MYLRPPPLPHSSRYLDRSADGVNHVVPHAIASFNDLTWADPQREPESGRRGDLLSPRYQSRPRSTTRADGN